MTTSRWILCAAMVAALLVVRPAGAQPQTIPSEIVQSQQTLTAAQRNVVRAKVDADLHRLQTGDPTDIAEARKSLIEGFRQPGASRIFLLDYSARISGNLGPVLAADRPLPVRLNAMIVASHLVDAGVIEHIRTGLTDPSPAVRYWAAKAATKAAGQLGDGLHARLLEILRPAVNKAQGDHVAGQLLLAVIALSPPEAIDLAINALNERITARAADIRLSPAPDRAAMRALFPRIIFQLDSLPDATPRGFIRITYRHLVLSARLADPGATRDEQITGVLRQDNIEMVRYADRALREMLKAVEADMQAVPGPIDELATAGKWADIRALRLPAWKQYLSKPPFNFTDAELAVAGRDQ